MSNYQLYRTNVKLGGQMKWDLTIEGKGDKLYVNDFKISPISDRIPFNRYAQDDLLNYSILEDIKSYYPKVKGSFYNEGSDPTLTTLEPYMIDGDLPKSQYKDVHNDTLEMGMKRANYSVYGKQLSFFCPVWIESLDPEKEYLSFHVSLRGQNRQGEWIDVATKTISLKTGNQIIHDRFVERFNEYIRTIQPNNKCININLEEEKTFITGICPETGLMYTTEALSLAHNLLAQERLMMEFDSLILDEYVNREMIVKQLINFNFLFDLDEMVPASLRSTMYGCPFTLAMSVYINDKDGKSTKLETRDFYSQYEFIPCTTRSGELCDVNVFSDLIDYNNIDLIEQNKIEQPIVHWSLADKEDYIFNLYAGFGGVLITKNEDDPSDEGEKLKLRKVYGNAADIWVEPSTTDEAVNTNSINWLPWVSDDLNLTTAFAASRIYAIETQYLSFATRLDEWVNNIHYTNSVVLNKADHKNLQIVMGVYDDAAIDEIISGGKFCSIDPNDNNGDDGSTRKQCIYYLEPEENGWQRTIAIFFYKDELDNAAFRKFRDILTKWTGRTEWMDSLLKWMNDIVEPRIIRFENLLKFMRTNGPSIRTNEVEHYKIQSQPEYVFRYDGNIKPAFCELMSGGYTNNTIYTKETILSSDVPDSIYSQWEKYGYRKIYPSVDYFAFVKHDLNHPVTDDGVDYTKVCIDGSPKDEVLDLPYESKWFNESECLYLHADITLNIKSKGTDNLTPLIIAELIEYYSLTGDDAEDKAKYILSLYNVKIDWEYESLVSVVDYIYTIKLTLK